jgi:hypothetical protein
MVGRPTAVLRDSPTTSNDATLVDVRGSTIDSVEEVATGAHDRNANVANGEGVRIATSACSCAVHPCRSWAHSRQDIEVAPPSHPDKNLDET